MEERAIRTKELGSFKVTNFRHPRNAKPSISIISPFYDFMIPSMHFIFRPFNQ